MATVRNLVIDQGTSYSITITVSDANGNTLNLDGYTVSGQMRKSYGAISYVPFTTVINLPSTDGEITISLDPDQTSALRAGRYVYDIEIVDMDEKVTRVLEGIVTITPEVTR
jgi:hypothetical protein